MVRVRKNANKLTAKERDRFLLALAKLNSAAAPATSGYQTLRNMHVTSANGEEHSGPHFLPWHRSYLLDLERQLQAIDPSVSMHYWRFDEPAPNVFTRSFMGETRRSPSTASFVVLDPANPLVAWITDSVPGILRSASFNTLTTGGAGRAGFRVAQPGPDAGARHRLCGIQRDGRHAAWRGARVVQWMGLVDPDRAERSAVLHAARQRRSAVGALAVAEQADEPGRSQYLHAAESRRPAARTTRCGRGTASSRRLVRTSLLEADCRRRR